ncbi:helicase SKI2W-like isoform X1 [Amphibalanus amphitrite]|uniref:helicase SKI2W-like isoform X1 n=1 Tax=Amphibalanus amphitrite TaxID=1232801 RepID=UPI001C90C37A|nr:helicase SKI2W-like isoform X1 [Amphibalanus amphitrite]XP_043214937.1 helicase SKI2W-like isoform X1 [Amphibalanus amphitrite]XP_043214938.1 helicase SKI2W-like isoform X1 [Amphibalanus amphitrite]
MGSVRPPSVVPLEERTEQFLTSPDGLPIHDFRYCQEYVAPAVNYADLLATERSPVATMLQVDRDPTTGRVLTFSEVPIDAAELGRTAHNSFSFRRAPGPPEQDVRGDVANFPFWPGGSLEAPPPPPAVAELDTLLPDEYLTTAPGLSEGLSLPSLTDQLDATPAAAPVSSGPEPEPAELGYDWVWQRPEGEQPVAEMAEWDREAAAAADQADGEQQAAELEAALKPEPALVLSTAAASDARARSGRALRSSQWAEEVDISRPVEDFHRQVPNMAHRYPYELDTFQKLAILHMERGESVFVAAHTSAGKTAVAEYAIALSQRNGTKAVYTSPIKALSNQKFRDFKNSFTDVGLLTGDIQINKEASCLICTTEILRSMLYNGSDLIRDLEWVIFDEVHYINDPERGVVWEESLILLPETVGIVLLSATVPNTLEFADWIGSIKKRKVRVISTLKRPVPLEHFLYTGQGGKSRDDRFLVLDSRGQFSRPGYIKAVDAKTKASSKSGGGGGAGRGGRGGGRGGHGGGSGITPQQERNTWVGLVDHLRRADLLPVVAFTFSRARCDANAASLTSLQLTSEREKGEIRMFFSRCAQRLAAADQKLPQVTQMAELLTRGVGVHHSGILPILKEVIEMLFQRGLVKLLFATETFAMGVNMPARTVVFDSIRKHDGRSFRTLLPGEYIQMAGRAGRRGLDPTGTVIVLCKHEVPEESELHNMMLGRPTKLVSQFHLTYSMILNLLRIQQLRIQDIMKSSFAETGTQKNRAENERRLASLQEQSEKQKPAIDKSCRDIEDFVTLCRDYLQMRDSVRERLYASNAGVKALENAGQIVTFSTERLSRRLGVILQVHRGGSGSLGGGSGTVQFTVLACDDDVRPEGTSPLAWRMRQAVSEAVYEPSGPASYGLHTIQRAQVDLIMARGVKVEAVKVVDDVKKRQLARFADNPPSPSCALAIRELVAAAGGPARQLHNNQLELADDLISLERLRARLLEMECLLSPSFHDTLEAVCRHRLLLDQLNDIKFQLSDESLSLLPEYCLRVDVLKRLGYVDSDNVVKLKGRVGCQMGYREMLVTELVFHDVLTGREPAEIAALLSALVFEQKRCSEPNLTPVLEKGKLELTEIAAQIDACQHECGLNDAEKHEEMLNFGLVEVVYEWSRGMTFSAIMQLTDVQEGIIVRCIQRLDETLRDVKNAARTIGNPTLYEKAGEASTSIKRDIVFAASLYTQT